MRSYFSICFRPSQEAHHSLRSTIATENETFINPSHGVNSNQISLNNSPLIIKNNSNQVVKSASPKASRVNNNKRGNSVTETVV